MEQHPIPQEISSYEFRLVGDMTLKQFFQLAGGLLISFLFYSTNLPVFIKWPFIIFFALFGAALAFVPFQDRPLERWILAFFRSVYLPTEFIWQRGSIKQKFFRDEAVAIVTAPSNKVIAPHGEEALENYLSTPAAVKNPLFKKLEEAEDSFLLQMSTLFGPGSPSSGQVKISETSSKEASDIFEKKTMPMAENPVIKPIPVVVEHKSEPVEISKDLTGSGVNMTTVNPVMSSAGMQAKEAVQFSPEAAPPNPPTTPNTIVGQVMDEEGKIVEGAIMEIRDSFGSPVRALKSNMLGHFMIVTPLQNGKYEIIIEKDGFRFETVGFEALGEIIPPIAIRGRKEPNIVVTEQPARTIPAAI